MLKELKFVQGAVAKKDFLPALTHFRIEDGFVRSYDGSLALCSPINFDIDCTPKAIPFVKAIQNCKDTVTLNMTAAGRLGIKSGKFKAYIECVEEETPHVVPEGDDLEIDGEALLTALKTLSPFIGDDASRPWSNGILIDGPSAYATNNVTLVEYWIGGGFPLRINIPRDAVREMLRINEVPIRAQATDNSISFHYEDGRWIRTALLNSEWPDLGKVLNTESNPVPIDERIFEALDHIKPFTDKMGRVYIADDVIATTIEKEDGAAFEVPGLGFEGVYQLELLAKLKGIALQGDFTLYPKPCMFFGDSLRGAIIGLRS